MHARSDRRRPHPISRAITIALATTLWASEAPAEPSPAESARLFGTFPTVWGLRISPDGSKVSFLQQHGNDTPLAIVVDLETGKGNILAASEPGGDIELRRCAWANETRLLCGYAGVAKFFGEWAGGSRLLAVDADGRDKQVLVQRQQRREYSFHQDRIVDWLPEDPKRILLALFDRDEEGTGISSVDIYKNRLKKIEPARPKIWDWISDGRGNLRVRLRIGEQYQEWTYRKEGDRKWRPLHRSETEEIYDAFHPLGFGDDPNKLYIADDHDGRVALFAQDLSEGGERALVFAHPEVDIDGVLLRLGKHRRLAAVSYTTERRHYHYFDARLEEILRDVESLLPDEIVHVVGETDDARFYLVWTESDLVPGTYYRFDSKTRKYVRITNSYPHLDGVRLSQMIPWSHPAEDGEKIPAYLTLPAGRVARPLPTIILPHGGPESRDEWGFDWLVQFLAHQGYAVLQSNFRGSAGYGSDWIGRGGFREWPRAISDIESGARALVAEGIADPERMCVLGWSYGGYAALMSAIENPERYQCVVAIAPITDLERYVRGFARGRTLTVMKEWIGLNRKVVNDGSPRHRAREIQAPVLLFHGRKDIHVEIDHSEWMEKALEKANKPVELVEYEDVAHSIRRQAHRIDMLTRIGEFLAEHLAVRAPRSRAK